MLLQQPCFMVGSPSPYVTTLVTLVASGIMVVEIETFMICHLISKEHVFKEFCQFMGWRFS